MLGLNPHGFIFSLVDGRKTLRSLVVVRFQRRTIWVLKYVASLPLSIQMKYTILQGGHIVALGVAPRCGLLFKALDWVSRVESLEHFGPNQHLLQSLFFLSAQFHFFWNGTCAWARLRLKKKFFGFQTFV